MAVTKATKPQAPVSKILQIKRAMMRHIKADTSILEVGETINFKHSKTPYAWMQIGPGMSDDSSHGVQDEKHEVGIRIVALSEDELWKAIEEIRVLWLTTGTGSNYEELRLLGCFNPTSKSTNPGFIFDNNGELTCDLMFRIEVRYPTN
jgi:hypothetical protein